MLATKEQRTRNAFKYAHMLRNYHKLPFSLLQYVVVVHCTHCSQHQLNLFSLFINSAFDSFLRRLTIVKVMFSYRFRPNLLSPHCGRYCVKMTQSNTAHVTFNSHNYYFINIIHNFYGYEKKRTK